MPDVRIHELTIADEPATWAGLGFAVEGDVCRVGGVPLRLAGRRRGTGTAPSGRAAGLLGWTLHGAASDALDGLPTRLAGDVATPAAGPAAAHPNGVTALDHVVAITPVLDRTVAALRAAGLDLRRIREEPTLVGALR